MCQEEQNKMFAHPGSSIPIFLDTLLPTVPYQCFKKHSYQLTLPNQIHLWYDLSMFAWGADEGFNLGKKS
jgi:hypothetical protein